MAHPAQEEFIRSCLHRFRNLVAESSSILEVGSQNLNGSVRDYFPFSEDKNWLGLDLGPGSGVDLVVPGELIQLPTGWSDISLSAECFEHAQNWKDVLMNMIRITRPQGLLVLTFAGPGRPAHGTIDSDLGSSPYTGQYYKNISFSALMDAVDLSKYFDCYAIEANQETCDTFFWGIRSCNQQDTELMSVEDSLARTRGQLGAIVSRNLMLKKELDRQRLISKSPILAGYLFLKRLLNR